MNFLIMQYLVVQLGIMGTSSLLNIYSTSNYKHLLFEMTYGRTHSMHLFSITLNI